MSEPIKVMLVDDHAVVRMGFKMLLESASDIKVIADFFLDQTHHYYDIFGCGITRVD